METTTIKLEAVGDGIWLLTLNRPEVKNALSSVMRREISAVLARLAADGDARALVVTGAGTAFCAGFDIGEFGRPELAAEVFESSARYHRDLWRFPKPAIAAVNGAALGGGFDLAALCDVRLCSPQARFGHPEIKLGGPPLFTALRFIVGDSRAREMCLTGRRFGADEALHVGIVSEVVSPEELLPRALGIARQILEAPDATLAFTKRTMMENPGRSFEEAFAVEHDEAFRRFLLREPG
ncbi:MAG: enoyl-CoA hydratase/isomerase family protein [Deltaproteobacteria bacterium]|nr:enoyl-CoA hydratase/isomerase family protein [Deltaproteobacteria bacterium]